MKIRNVTARKFSSLMDKNSGLSLPRVAADPRKDPNRGVGLCYGVPLATLGKCDQGLEGRGRSAAVVSHGGRGERRKAHAVRSTGPWCGKQGAARSFHLAALILSGGLRPPRCFPWYQYSTPNRPIASELFTPCPHYAPARPRPHRRQYNPPPPFWPAYRPVWRPGRRCSSR